MLVTWAPPGLRQFIAAIQGFLIFGFTFSKPENLLSFKVHVWRWGAASGVARVLTCVYMEEFINQLGTDEGWQILTPAYDFVTTPGDVVGISYEWSAGTPVNFLGLSAVTGAVVLKGAETCH